MRQKIQILFLVTIAFLFSRCDNGEKLHRELSKMADSLNEAAPVQLDEHTFFLGAAVARDNTFEYRYRVINTPNPDSLMQAMENQTYTNIKKAFTINPDLKIFTENRVNINYIYADSVGQTLKVIHITPKDYE